MNSVYKLPAVNRDSPGYSVADISVLFTLRTIVNISFVGFNFIWAMFSLRICFTSTLPLCLTLLQSFVIQSVLNFNGVIKIIFILSVFLRTVYNDFIRSPGDACIYCNFRSVAGSRSRTYNWS